MAVNLLLQHGINQTKAAWPPYNHKLRPCLMQHGHTLSQHGSNYVVAAAHNSNNGSMASFYYTMNFAHQWGSIAIWMAAWPLTQRVVHQAHHEQRHHGTWPLTAAFVVAAAPWHVLSCTRCIIGVGLAIGTSCIIPPTYIPRPDIYIYIYIDIHIYVYIYMIWYIYI